MQQITIAGVLVKDAEICVDESSHKYTRFIVSCATESTRGRIRYFYYNCFCYLPGCERLRANDQVFLTGKFSAELKLNEKGEPCMDFSIMVFQASVGYKSEGVKGRYDKQ